MVSTVKPLLSFFLISFFISRVSVLPQLTPFGCEEWRGWILAVQGPYHSALTNIVERHFDEPFSWGREVRNFLIFFPTEGDAQDLLNRSLAELSGDQPQMNDEE